MSADIERILQLRKKYTDWRLAYTSSHATGDSLDLIRYTLVSKETRQFPQGKDTQSGHESRSSFPEGINVWIRAVNAEWENLAHQVCTKIILSHLEPVSAGSSKPSTERYYQALKKGLNAAFATLIDVLEEKDFCLFLGFEMTVEGGGLQGLGDLIQAVLMDVCMEQSENHTTPQLHSERFRTIFGDKNGQMDSITRCPYAGFSMRFKRIIEEIVLQVGMPKLKATQRNMDRINTIARSVIRSSTDHTVDIMIKRGIEE